MTPGAPALGDVTTSLAALTVVAGLAVAGFGTAARRDLRATLPLALDMWAAAGLLRLTGHPDWASVGGAAAVLAVRKLVVWALRRPVTRAARSPS